MFERTKGLQGGIEAPGVGNLFIRIRSSIGSHDILPYRWSSPDTLRPAPVKPCAEIHALKP